MKEWDEVIADHDEVAKWFAKEKFFKDVMADWDHATNADKTLFFHFLAEEQQEGRQKLQALQELNQKTQKPSDEGCTEQSMVCDVERLEERVKMMRDHPSVPSSRGINDPSAIPEGPMNSKPAVSSSFEMQETEMPSSVPKTPPTQVHDAAGSRRP